MIRQHGKSWYQKQMMEALLNEGKVVHVASSLGLVKYTRKGHLTCMEIVRK
jgi:hypothetical protein